MNTAWTRRLFLRRAAQTSLLVALRRKACNAGLLSWPVAALLDTAMERRYRADAVVLLFSIPVLHRSGVGRATAVWRQSSQSDGEVLRLLEFLGYSDPQRAAGLNRLGFIRELVRLSGRQVTEALYFGLMTSSPEENAEDARKALHSNAAEASYSVIQGRTAGGDCSSTSARFTASAKFSADQRNQLEALGKKALESGRVSDTEFTTRDTTPPFLEALTELLSSPERNEGQYIYNGRLYRIWLRRHPDDKATQHFRSRHLASGEVVRVSGTLRRVSGGREWEFRLWVEQGAAHPLPLRIEYQPKSYLRLVFEAES
jgi:hypothetical protein